MLHNSIETKYDVSQDLNDEEDKLVKNNQTN